MSDTKKPVDPIFGHHSVVRERPAQESATTAKKCSIEGCGGSLTYPGGLELPAFYCWTHDRAYLSEWQYCDEKGCYQWTPAVAGHCAKHGGQDYIPRTTESSAMTGNYKREGFTHCGVCDQILPHMEQCIPRATDYQNPAQPEAKPCDDGNTPRTIAEELISLGVLPLVPLTPEEKAQDLIRWRQDIEEHNRAKEAK